MNSSTNFPEILDVETVGELLRHNAHVTLIDVRTPSEFESVHIPGSYNVPLDLLPEHRAELSAALRSPVVLVCRSGNRASQAVPLMRESSLTRVHILEGGMNAWEAAGKEVRRGQQRWSLERQVRGLAGGLVASSALAGLFVSPWLGLGALFVGGGLAFSAVTDTCGMAMLLSKLPYNRGASCDMREVVARLATSEPATTH